MPAADALPAATVVLLRESRDATGMSTFLLTRARERRFMPGVRVFPGGRIDAADADPALLSRCTGREVLAERLGVRDVELWTVHAIGAMRELYEEAGVLLAETTRGELPPQPAAMRQALCAGECTFADVCGELHLRLRMADLLPAAHWVTPATEPRRFDTRFFLARMPHGQIATPDGGESVEGSWQPIAAALQAHAAGDLTLAPPTLRTLEQLACHATTSDAFAARWAPHCRIEPRHHQDGERWLLLPGDALYPATPEQSVSGPTRFVWRSGRWFSAEGPGR